MASSYLRDSIGKASGTRRGSELHLGYRPVAPARVPEGRAVPSEKRSATVPIPGTMSRPRG